MLKRLAKSFLPRAFIVILRRAWTSAGDLFSGKTLRFASSQGPRVPEADFPAGITITQGINKSRYADNKKHNLRISVDKFQNLLLMPGQIFSFWHLVGNPTEKRGFVKGINIIRDQLDFDVGGGLCQLSGLLYHLAITADLKIIQRYCHSVDLYTDETRYTPLGADATVCFGYKDLRIQNNLSFPVCFRIEIEDFFLTGSLCAPEPLVEHELRYERDTMADRKIVRTFICREGGLYELLTTSTYLNSSHSDIL
jgi:vancomycin resistance protein VanW